MLDIILPCYNSDPELLYRSLDSIDKQKTDFSYFLYIVDDGSDSAHISRKSFHMASIYWAITRIVHSGLPAALNTGHLLGTSKYICWTSDDNMLEPDFVQKMVSTAEQGYDFVRCLEMHIPGGQIIDPRHGNSALPVAGLYDGYLGAGHIYRRDLYERTKGYDPEMAGIEDLDMYYQLMRLNPRVGFAGWPLYVYRDGTSRFSEERVAEARRKLIKKWGLK